MDFSLSEDQSILSDSISRFIDLEYDFESRQKISQSDGGFSRDMWATFAELGVTAVPFAEDDGGLRSRRRVAAHPSDLETGWHIDR